MAILDAHTHVFPPEVIGRREQIAQSDRGFSVIYSDRRSKMADGAALSAYLDREGIETAVVCGFPFQDGGLIRCGNDYVLDIARSDKRILPLISIDRRHEQTAVSEAERCLKQGARGVGEIAYYDTGFSEGERKSLEGLARYLEETGMVLMLHLNEQVGHHYAGKTDVNFGEVVRFVQAFPALRIILAHMGGGICFYEFMPEVRNAFSQVYYDLAAAPFLYSRGVYAFAAEFLGSKVLFGSDYPLLTLSRYKRELERLDDEAKSRLLYDNGRRLFFGA
jgi:hypothetical protein